MANLMVRFYRYANKSFCCDARFDALEDKRRGPIHPLKCLIWKMVGGIMTGFDSFNQLEEAIKDGDFDCLGGTNRPSADTFSRAFALSDPLSIIGVNDYMIQKSRYNKALQDVRVEGFRVVAIDGTGLFSTVSQRLGKDSHYRRGPHGEELEGSVYLEHALAISYVGGNGPLLLLALTRMPKGQGETTVAQSELKRLFAEHCRYCDVFTLDAGFAKAPVLNVILDENKEFVVRVKQENYDIIKDAAGLFDGVEPSKVHRDVKARHGSADLFDLEIWDEEEFTSWTKVNKPLRCIRVRETRKRVNAAGEVLDTGTITTHFVTSASKASMPALTVWKIAHLRWDIENTAIRFLKHHFRLEHAYSYDPRVIAVLLALFMLTFNLFMLFLHRNLRKWTTMKGTMRRLYRDLVRLKEPLAHEISLRQPI